MNQSDDLISVLAEDHRDLQQLLREVDYLTGSEPLRRSLADLMIAEMVRHAVAEESYVYPVVRKYVPMGELIVQHDAAGHREFESILRELDRPDLTGPEFSSLVARLKAETRPHLIAEEKELFPLLTKYLSEEELLDLGRKAAESKEKAAIRRYLMEPDCSLRERIVASGTTLVERIRTYLRSAAYPA